MRSSDLSQQETPSLPEAWRETPAVSGQVVTGPSLAALRALVAYVALLSGRSEFGVERALADHFEVPNMTLLPDALYDAAMLYLVEQIPLSREEG